MDGPRPRHRWQYWGVTICSLMVVMTPSLASDPEWEAGAVNATVAGVLLIGLAVFELVQLHVWTDIGQLVLGLWLAVSPYLIGYAAGSLGKWHLGVGTFLALLGMVSLVYERNRKQRCT